MPSKIYMSDLTWRSIAQQKYVLAEIIGWEDMPVFINPEDRDMMFRPTTRNAKETIYVASLAVIAKSEDDFVNFMKQCKARKKRLFSVEEKYEWNPYQDISVAARAWSSARRNGASKIGGNISARKKEDVTKLAIELIRADWPKPSSEFSTETLLERADISLNTAKKHLGRRPIEQANYQAKLKRKEKRDANKQ